MVSFKTTLLALAGVALVAADYYIDPDSVSLGTRQNWCANELSTCPIICQQIPPGTYEVNTCDPETLTYGCVCGNGLQPNVSEYSLTLPFFVCQEWGTQCQKKCGTDNTCASACVQDHPCGALNPSRTNTTTTTSATVSATASASNVVYTGLGDGSASSSSSSSSTNAAPALDSRSMYGMAILVGSIFVGFTLLL